MSADRSSRYVDLTGRRFGRLTVVADTGERKFGKSVIWRCVCDCGNEKLVCTRYLGRRTNSCGCLARGFASSIVHSVSEEMRVNHYLSRTREYASWKAMINRCQNPRDQAYDRYGGRGIAVCERWQRVENFVADMGTRPPGTTLDRIDNDRGYEPGNCRWATPKQQRANQRKAA